MEATPPGRGVRPLHWGRDRGGPLCGSRELESGARGEAGVSTFHVRCVLELEERACSMVCVLGGRWTDVLCRH